MAHNRGTKSQPVRREVTGMARTAYRRVFQGCSGRRFEDRVRQYPGRVHAGDTKQWSRLCAACGASLLFLCGNDECAPSRGFLLPRWDHANSDQSSWVVSERVRRDVKALKCGTSEPYTEPSNLEQFVRENRVQ